MPVYRITTQKFLSGEFWTNDYHVNAVSMNEAASVASQCLAAEKLFTHNSITIQKARVSTTTKGDRVHRIINYNQFGGRVIASALLPLWDCVYVDFPRDGDGEPGAKWYRGIPLDDCLGAVLSVDIINDTTNALVDLINNADAPLCLPDGTGVLAPAARALIGMHQLRRGSKRRENPII